MAKLSTQAAQRLAKKRQKLALKAVPKFVLEDFLFKEQLEFVRDPARYATAVTSVRAGKSTSCAADLMNTALEMPGTTGLYITLTRSSGKRIIWPELHTINREFKLGAIPNESELSMKFPNGSMIYLSGANNEVEIEKLRGLSNVALAYVDEAQSMRAHIKELVDEILVKRLYDTNGRCRLIGTPGPVPAGYFYEASQSDMWSHHSWTLHQNPFIQKKSGKTVTELIQQDMARKGVTVDDPSIQRECFGRWVLDTNSLLLNYNPELNHYDTLPQGAFTHILGIDLGWGDSDALSVLGWQENSPVVWLVDEVITPNQGIEELTNQIIALDKKYHFVKYRIDTGGLGKKIAEDIKKRKSIPVEAADKVGKLANYAFLNNALRTGNFRAKKTSLFAHDCNILERDKNKSTPDKIIVRGHSDAVDSALYAFKDSPAYAFTPPPPLTTPGTPEWSAEEQERMHQALFAQVKKEQDELNQLNSSYDPYTGEHQTDLTRWKRG